MSKENTISDQRKSLLGQLKLYIESINIDTMEIGKEQEDQYKKFISVIENLKALIKIENQCTCKEIPYVRRNQG